MSAVPLATRPSTPAPTPRRHLEAAPMSAPRRGRPRVLPAIITIAGIGVILLAQLLLSIVLADGAYTIASLHSQQRDLERQEQALTERLEVLSSTQNLVANAENFGMIASGNPVFLDVASGAVSGSPTAAGGSLTGANGNQVGNSLITDATLVDPVNSAQTSPMTSLGSGSQDGSGSPSGSTSPSETPHTIPSPTTR